MYELNINRGVLHGITVSTAIVAFALIQSGVPEPYSDEVFHIAQTQRFCDEDFESWDSSIPNPPGLYLLSAIPLMTVHIPCTPPILRSTNLVFTTVIIPSLISLIICTLSAPGTRGDILRHILRPSAEALVISIFPFISLYGNLYYTDVASLAGVLGAWALSMRGRHWSAALIGAWSMTVRQSNVIWFTFILGTTLLRMVREEEERQSKDDEITTRVDPMLARLSSPKQVVLAIMKTSDILSRKSGTAFDIMAPYIAPLMGFLGFLQWNGGLDLGRDKLPESTLHLPHALYFIAFATIMLLPVLLAEGIGPIAYGTLLYAVSSRSHLALSGALGVAMLLSVHKYSAFLPSRTDAGQDVSYHIQRFFVRYPAVRYQLISVYLFLFWAWVWRLRRRATFFWLILFVGCATLHLINRPVIDPREFLIPTIILRLQLTVPPVVQRKEGDAVVKKVEKSSASARGGDWNLALEYAWYTAINIITLYFVLTSQGADGKGGVRHEL